MSILQSLDARFAGLGIGVPKSSPVSLVQRGTTSMGTSLTVDVTISSVDTSRAVIRAWPYYEDDAATKESAVHIEFLNATTIRLTRLNTNVTSSNINWEVIEFPEVKSLQHGLTRKTTTTLNVTVSAVDPSKAILYHAGNSMDVNSTQVAYHTTVITLTSGTNIQMRSALQSSFDDVSWYLVEFN